MKHFLFLLGIVFWLASCAQPTTPAPTPTLALTEFPIYQSVNGIEMRMLGFERAKGYLTAEICYKPLDSSKHWQLDEIVLIVEGQEIPFSSYKSDLGVKSPEEFLCSNTSFPAGVNRNLGEVELIVGRLKTPALTDNDCQGAQNRLDIAKTGIVIECISTANSSGYAIKQRPENMSADEAFKIIDEAFLDFIQGPWRFKFVVRQP